MRRLSRKTARNMTLRYATSIFLIALGFAAHYAAGERRVEALKFSAAVMDKMGQQRMLSQRIAILSQSIHQSPSEAGRRTFRQELLSLAIAMKSTHEDLMRGNLPMKLPDQVLRQVKSIYTGPPFFLESHVQRYLSAARTLATDTDGPLDTETPHLLYVWSLAQSDQLVEGLNGVVRLYLGESDRVIRRNKILGRIQLGALLVLLLFMALFVFRPMTARIKLEMDQLEVEKIKLQREVTQRVHLTEQLEMANRELNDFAHVVSHDLKAPLRGIGSLASMLLDDFGSKFDAEGKKCMNLMIGRVKRMHGLIEGLLQLTQVGRTAGEKKPVELHGLVSEIIDSISPPKNVRIQIKKKLPTITFDGTRAQQLFQNLISNAVKYMDKPQGEIKIDWAEEAGLWRFNVQDNGPGIDKKYFQKIFEIFQTLAPRDTYESTGIGLSLVKRIVETAGGTVWVESEVGKGSSFFFTVPKDGKPEEQNGH